MRIILIAFVFVSFLFGFGDAGSCGGRTSNATPIPTPQKTINTGKHAYITRTCAPWDGPALTIQISDEDHDCEDIKTPYLRITIWKAIDDVSGKAFEFPDNELGVISFQSSKEEYKVAKKGTIRFEESDDSTDVFFDLDVEFEDGETVAGRFKAKWCQRQDFCG